jgi:thiosulfate/3-mercaptopyruvate sulfurtransferase
VIIGAGAIGATIAAQLHTAESAVLLVARGRQLAALRETGLRYVRPDGERTLRLPVAGSPDEVELTDSDVLVLAVKSQDTEQVLQDWSWRPVRRADGGTGAAATDLPILLLQNGLDNQRAALRRFAAVFAAMVLLPATYLAPGEVIAQGGDTVGALLIGRYPGGEHPALPGIAADLRAAGFAARVEPQITAWQASKLLTNLTNALDALYPSSELRKKAAGALAAEARAVFAAAGIPVLDRKVMSDDPDTAKVKILPVPGKERGGSSTWQSLARAGSLETDYLNGEIVLLARLAGLPAPLNERLAARVQRAAAEGVPAGSLDDADLAATLPGMAHPVLITAAELAVAESEPVLLDVRWALGDPHGHQHYLDGHIPGAVFVDLDTELAAPAGPAQGRHPLPDLADLEAVARRWGVTEGRPVVIYDNTGNTAAARAWWLLRWAGVADVRLLDGGLGAWTRAGNPVATGEETAAKPGDVRLRPGALPTLTADQAATWPESGVLLDARAGERYRGETEPVDPRAGHIPGAHSAPTVQNLAEDGTFRSPAELRARFAELGADAAPVGVYCGSGVTAAHEVAALAIAGIDAALYPGSWSQWANDPDRPAATGPEPR